MARLLLSAAHKSSGKTTVALGLCRALQNSGATVQPFKKGPDYIDPLWLGSAADRPCYNLDFQTQSHDEILSCFGEQAASADISIIEGNKGLHDGMELDGSNSNAALARLTQTPVVLVIDTQGMTRGVAPLVLGFQQFDKAVPFAGVILNKVGGSRHESKLRSAIEHYTDLPVLGAVQRDPSLHIRERHLGLVPSNEASQADAQIEHIAAAMSQQLDLAAIRQIAADAPLPDHNPRHRLAPDFAGLTIGIIRDAAFGFYYADDLEAFRQSGANIIYIDALHDPALPEIDGLFIGGGFPETHMQALERNRSLRRAIADAIERNLPVYAECGGLMYLSRRIAWKDDKADMVGAIPADTLMQERPVGRGYVQLHETGDHPWPRTPGNGSELNAHEFHYSRLEGLPENSRFAYTLSRGTGIQERMDGILHRNVLGTYAHQRHVAANPWVSRFLAYVQMCREQAGQEQH